MGSPAATDEQTIRPFVLEDVVQTRKKPAARLRMFYCYTYIFFVRTLARPLAYAKLATLPRAAGKTPQRHNTKYHAPSRQLG